MSAVSRRSFLSAAGVVGLAGCGGRRVQVAQAPTGETFAPVKVSADRVIRTTVGLRPFRPAGFVVRTEKLGSKIVIHNYGHGGAGITLSWGTAMLAADEAAQTGVRECAVIGCGVVGLSTARILQQRGYDPTIYAKEMPPGTTSNLAGGLWDPVTVYDRDRLTPEFRKQFDEAARRAHRRYQLLAGEEYGVRWLPLFDLSSDEPLLPFAPESPRSNIQDLFPETRAVNGSANPFGVQYGRRRDTLLIEPSIYLDKLVRDFRVNGGKIQIRTFASANELSALPEGLLFNCTGLGARELFGDNELVPIRGQLSILLPQPEIDYCTVGPDDIYMFPRHDGIVLGGSHERGVWSTEPDAATSQRILDGNAKLFGGMRRRGKRP